MSRDITPIVEAWLAEPAPVAQQGIERVGQLVNETKQRRSRLPAPPRRLESMLSPTTTLAAGVALALASGLVLSGSLTSPSGEPMPAAVSSADATAAADTAEPIVDELEPVDADPGALVLDEVRGGIERVIGDGAGHTFDDAVHVAATPDGQLWVATQDHRLFVLGEPGSLDPVAEGYPHPVSGIVALSDGRIAVHDGGRVGVWDGDDWMIHWPIADGDQSQGAPWIIDLAVDDDGTIWILYGTHGGPKLAQIGTDGPRAIEPSDLGLGTDDLGWITGLAATADGSLWISQAAGGDGTSPALLRRVDGAWTRVDPLGTGERFDVHRLEAAADGSLTAWIGGPGRDRDRLAHWDGSTWTVGTTGQNVDSPYAPDKSKWPSTDWLRWWNDSWTDHYSITGLSDARVQDSVLGADGTEWLIVTNGRRQNRMAGPTSGLYRVDPVAAEASRPEFQWVGRHGMVPLLHPRFASDGRGTDGNARAVFTKRQGSDVVAEIFALGDTWYAHLDAIAPGGDRWVNNRWGVGEDPISALKDALRKEKKVPFVKQAADSAMMEWPRKDN